MSDKKDIVKEYKTDEITVVHCVKNLFIFRIN